MQILCCNKLRLSKLVTFVHIIIIYLEDEAVIMNLSLIAVVCLAAPFLCGGFLLALNTHTEHKKREPARNHPKLRWLPKITLAADAQRIKPTKYIIGETNANRVIHESSVTVNGNGKAIELGLGGSEYDYYILEVGY